MPLARCRCAWRRGKILYLGFEDRLDPVLALAVERMTGLRVESGLVQESLFRPAHTRMLECKVSPGGVDRGQPRSRHSFRSLARRIETARPVESRLVRVHDCLWLRMWTDPQKGPLPQIDIDRGPDLFHPLFIEPRNASSGRLRHRTSRIA